MAKKKNKPTYKHEFRSPFQHIQNDMYKVRTNDQSCVIIMSNERAQSKKEY